jgi:sterol desaturase/sphingolipid hydroxylase (fatty acid hydroxylase superfamily)
MEELVQQNFQIYKGMGVGVSLVLILFFQMLFPNRHQLRDFLMIWKVNVPRALIDAALLSLACGACVCSWAMIVRGSGLAAFDRIGFPYWFQVAVTVLVLAFVAYAWHRANHVTRFLWRFHSVHHSDTCFEVTTAFRFHPGELMISLGVRLVVVTLTGLPLLGLIVFEIVYAFFNLFVHRDIRLAPILEGPLSKIFITPSLHRLHHSDRPEELNTNFGTIFSFWDRLGKSYIFADISNQVSVGLPGQQGAFLSLRKVLTLPFKG